MATSAINFESWFTLNSSYTLGECEFSFTPPSNISGKLCYVEAKIFALSWDDIYATPQPYHSFVLRGSWAQVQTRNVEPRKEGLNTPLAVYHYGQASHTSVPTLVQIPAGPHNVRFWLTRLDLGPMGVATTDLSFMICFNIVPADSRQTPLA